MNNHIIPSFVLLCVVFFPALARSTGVFERESSTDKQSMEYSHRESEATKLLATINQRGNEGDNRDMSNQVFKLGFDLSWSDDQYVITNNIRAKVLSELSVFDDSVFFAMHNDFARKGLTEEWMGLYKILHDCFFEAESVPIMESGHFLDGRRELEQMCPLSPQDEIAFRRFLFINRLTGAFSETNTISPSVSEQFVRLFDEGVFLTNHLWKNGIMVFLDPDHETFGVRRFRKEHKLSKEEIYNLAERYGDRQMSRFPIWSFVSSAPILARAKVQELALTGTNVDFRLFGALVRETIKGEKIPPRLVFSAPFSETSRVHRAVLDSDEYLLFLCPVPPPIDLSEKPAFSPQYKLFGFWQSAISLSGRTDEWSNFVLKKQFGISSPDEILPFFRFAVRYAKAPPEERARLDDEASEMGEPYKKLVESAKEYFTRKESKP